MERSPNRMDKVTWFLFGGRLSRRQGIWLLVLGSIPIAFTTLGYFLWDWGIELIDFMNLALGLTFVSSGGWHLLYEGHGTLARLLGLIAVLAFVTWIVLAIIPIVWRI